MAEAGHTEAGPSPGGTAKDSLGHTGKARDTSKERLPGKDSTSVKEAGPRLQNDALKPGSDAVSKIGSDAASKMGSDAVSKMGPDAVMNQPTGSPAGKASAGLGQTGQSAERARGANPDATPPTPARQPHGRTVNTPPGEPYNDDTEPRH
jgi:hypothetical protein